MIQAKDLSDAVMFVALEATRGQHGVPGQSSLFDVQAHMGNVPPKVVLSKLRSMLKRSMIDGCGCGCRGDFRLGAGAPIAPPPEILPLPSSAVLDDQGSFP